MHGGPPEREAAPAAAAEELRPTPIPPLASPAVAEPSNEPPGRPADKTDAWAHHTSSSDPRTGTPAPSAGAQRVPLPGQLPMTVTKYPM